MDLYNEQAGRGYDISFSEGIVTVDITQNQSVEELLESADDLMYKKKRAVA
jgi:PleD family two-component response regulator